MVGRSDIEFDGEDSNLSMDLEDSNLSEPTSRQLRTRKSRQDPEPVEEEKKVTRSARLGIKNKRLMDKEREEFLNQFDQNKSERERRKKDTKQTYATGGRCKSTLLGIFLNFPKPIVLQHAKRPKYTTRKEF